MLVSQAAFNLAIVSASVIAFAAGASTLTGALSAKGGAIFNEDSADVDFRVESNNNANMLVVNGGSNLVGIGDDPDLGEGLHIKQGDSGASANSSSDNLVIESSGTAGINILTGSGGNGVIDFGDSADNNIGRIIYNHTGNAFSFVTNASTNMTIGNTGDVLATATIGGAGSYSNTTSGGANVHILSSGVLVRSTSSLKYKNTINDATHGLTELLKLRPVTYKGNNDGDTVFGGLIAEEVHDAGLTEFVQYNEDNKPDALAYGNMVSLCIKAIQELKTELDNAKARITALENA